MTREYEIEERPGEYRPFRVMCRDGGKRYMSATAKTREEAEAIAADLRERLKAEPKEMK